MGRHSVVNILIGMDHNELHYAYQEIRGRPDEPVARLTPLDWSRGVTVSQLQKDSVRWSGPHFLTMIHIGLNRKLKDLKDRTPTSKEEVEQRSCQ